MDMCHQSPTSLHQNLPPLHPLDKRTPSMRSFSLWNGRNASVPPQPLTETSRGGSSPMSPSIQKHYPRALQGLCRHLLRRGLCPPPPSQSMGPCYRAPPQCQTPQREDVPPLTCQAEGTR